MAEKQVKRVKQEKTEKQVQEQKGKERREEEYETLIRIFGYDVPGSKNLYTGLTYIKGISWTISNAVCVKSGIPKSKKLSEMSKDEIRKVENTLSQLDVFPFLKNRRYDSESGETSHLYGSDLDMTKEFDIKRMKKIRSYKGIRHSLGQPVRGQRTASHFRKIGQAVGVKRSK